MPASDGLHRLRGSNPEVGPSGVSELEVRTAWPHPGASIARHQFVGQPPPHYSGWNRITNGASPDRGRLRESAYHHLTYISARGNQAV